MISRAQRHRAPHSLVHLEHKRAHIHEQIIPRADPTKNGIDNPQPRLIRRHKAPRLCQDRHDRRLSQHRRFPAHVWARDDVYGRRGANVQVVGDEGTRRGRGCHEAIFDSWVACVEDVECRSAGCQSGTRGKSGTNSSCIMGRTQRSSSATWAKPSARSSSSSNPAFTKRSSCRARIWQCRQWRSSHSRTTYPFTKFIERLFLRDRYLIVQFLYLHPQHSPRLHCVSAILYQRLVLTLKRYVLAVFPERTGMNRSSCSTSPAFDFLDGTWTYSPGARGLFLSSRAGVSDLVS